MIFLVRSLRVSITFDKKRPIAIVENNVLMKIFRGLLLFFTFTAANSVLSRMEIINV